MILQLATVICSLTLFQDVVSQRGEFASFGDDVNDSVFSKMTTANVRDESGGYRSILWTLPRGFPAFGQSRTQIRVRQLFVLRKILHIDFRYQKESYIP